MKYNVPTDFTSVHEYLDGVFKGQSPTAIDIIQAKQCYWRAYNTNLKRKQRSEFKSIRIKLNKKEHLALQKMLPSDRPLSQSVHTIVMNYLEGDVDPTPRINTALIEQQLFFIAEYLKELAENMDTDRACELEQHIHTLETLIEENL